jgi:hypothetical protein
MPNSPFTPEQISQILEEFFKAVGTRQYIGARYVPIFGRKGETSIQWDNTKPYEPLTIVLYQGNSYTSRQYVPEGVEITNELFWALTGNYNAQVEAYRNEVQGFTARIDAVEESDTTQTAQLAGTSSSGLKTLIDTNTDHLADVDAQLAGTTDSGLRALINQNAADIETLETFENDQTKPILNGFIGDDPINAKEYIDAKQATRLISAEDYGAIGDGVTDSTQAIQAAIDANPNSTITFKGGVYIISDTILLNADLDSVSLDLNGSTIKWNGANGSAWSEGDPVSYIPNTHHIFANPPVMFGVSRRATTAQSAGQTVIKNGTIDGNHRASIAIQNIAFVSVFTQLRIQHFQYAGIYNGTDDGATYNLDDEMTSAGGMSTQTLISDCYFVRGEDMSARPKVSCIFITYPDNQIDNCVTNRTDIGITMRIGGNSVSNTHITTQYAQSPGDVGAANYKGVAVRLWPLNSGATQINLFDNCYFNAMKWVFYTYHDSEQAFTGANLRTICSNSHYTFYTSSQFTSRLDAVWYGGMWYGVMQTLNCAFLYGDHLFMHKDAYPVQPSIGVARASECSIGNIIAPHENSSMLDAANYVTDEWFPISSSSAPIPANTYKCVARIVSKADVYDGKVPGSYDIEIAAENGLFTRKLTVYPNSTDYTVNVDESHGNTTMKLYIRNNAEQYTFNGLTYAVARIYAFATANITDVRFLKISPSSPFVDVYGFAWPINFETGSNSNITTIIPTNLVELI